MTKLLRSPWVATGVGAILFLLTVVLCWPQKKPSEPTEPAAKAGPSWTFQNPEVDQLISELKKEKEAQAEKRKQLNELEVRLRAERGELNQVTQTIHQLQLDFDRNVVRVEEGETANLKKLAKVYSSMAPSSAVLILKEMDETTLVKIMALMKDSEAAPILECLAKQGEAEAKRAAALSDRLRLSLVKPANSASATQ
jgi:flagellar motility protein MotE (MotC chaperone)